MAPFQIIGNEWFFVIIIIIVFVFGEKKIPELAKSLGKAIGEFQKARTTMEKEIRAATQAIQSPITETTQAIKDSIQSPITETTQAIKDSIQSPITETTQAIKESLEEKTKISSPTPSLTERDKLEKVAYDLGIITEGKTDEQLKVEIKKKLT